MISAWPRVGRNFIELHEPDDACNPKSGLVFGLENIILQDKWAMYQHIPKGHWSPDSAIVQHSLARIGIYTRNGRMWCEDIRTKIAKLCKPRGQDSQARNRARSPLQIFMSVSSIRGTGIVEDGSSHGMDSFSLYLVRSLDCPGFG